MANRIPVGATIAETYGFAFGGFLSILGIIWFPAVLLAAAGYFVGGHLMPVFQGSLQNQDPTQILHMLPLFGLFYLAILLLFVMQYVGVTELALGLRGRRSVFYFSLGGTFWRVLAAWILVVLILILVEVVLGIAFGIVTAIGALFMGVSGSGAQHHSALVAGIAGIVVALAAIVLYGAMIYIATRLSFLITPAVIAEKKIAIARSWSLSKGNFWRIVLVWLAVELPMLLLIVGGEFAIIFPTLGQQMIESMQHPMAPEQALQTYVQAFATAGAWAHAYWYILFPVGLVISVIYLGLAAGMHAFAYRALTAGDTAASA